MVRLRFHDLLENCLLNTSQAILRSLNLARRTVIQTSTIPIDGVADRSAFLANVRSRFHGIDVSSLPDDWLASPSVFLLPCSLFWEAKLREFAVALSRCSRALD